jgi:putative hydrolase of the HAD superfamily
VSDTGLRAIVSDFGGVLTSPLQEAFRHVQNGIELPAKALGRAMARAIERDGEHPLYELETGRISEAEFFGRLERALFETEGAEISLHGFGTRLMEALRPNDALFAHYRSLRDGGLRFALLTNNVREWEPLWRPKLPIDDVFEVVVDSAFVGMRKPDPEIYAITLERLGLPASACAFVDDIDINVEAARALGFRGVLFRDTAQAVAELDALLAG